MDAARLRRYKEKLDLIGLRLREFEEWSGVMLTSEKDKLASYKCFQEVSEAVNDIIAMMLRDEKLLPAEDYPNIEKAISHRLIPLSLKVPLQEMTGLRNRLVHHYNGIDDRVARDSARTLLTVIRAFVAHVRQWLREKK